MAGVEKPNSRQSKIFLKREKGGTDGDQTPRKKNAGAGLLELIFVGRRNMNHLNAETQALFVGGSRNCATSYPQKQDVIGSWNPNELL